MNEVTQVTRETNNVFLLDHIEYPDEGGIYVYLKDVLYPTKGFQTPESVGSNNLAKRLFIGYVQLFGNRTTLAAFSAFLLLPWKYKMRVVGHILNSFNNLAKIPIQPYRMKDKFYCIPCKELEKLIVAFLINLGVSENIAKSFGARVKHMIEFDTAYRLYIQDILSETNTYKLKADVRGELQRLLEVYAKRMGDRKHLVQKFAGLVRILSVAFLLPRVRKAFFSALDVIDFSKLHLDQADRYHVLRFGNYDFMGLSAEIRAKTYIDMHKGKIPQSYNVNNLEGVKV